jgi:hypothetical protein
MQTNKSGIKYLKPDEDNDTSDIMGQVQQIMRGSQ